MKNFLILLLIIMIVGGLILGLSQCEGPGEEVSSESSSPSTVRVELPLMELSERVETFFISNGGGNLVLELSTENPVVWEIQLPGRGYSFEVESFSSAPLLIKKGFDWEELPEGVNTLKSGNRLRVVNTTSVNLSIKFIFEGK